MFYNLFPGFLFLSLIETDFPWALNPSILEKKSTSPAFSLKIRHPMK
jgi:hypothetical protein